jgi:hypothetical protein
MQVRKIPLFDKISAVFLLSDEDVILNMGHLIVGKELPMDLHMVYQQL